MNFLRTLADDPQFVDHFRLFLDAFMALFVVSASAVATKVTLVNPIGKAIKSRRAARHHEEDRKAQLAVAELSVARQKAELEAKVADDQEVRLARAVAAAVAPIQKSIEKSLSGMNAVTTLAPVQDAYSSPAFYSASLTSAPATIGATIASAMAKPKRVEDWKVGDVLRVVRNRSEATIGGNIVQPGQLVTIGANGSANYFDIKEGDKGCNAFYYGDCEWVRSGATA